MLSRYVEYGADTAKILNDSQDDQITDTGPDEFLIRLIEITNKTTADIKSLLGEANSGLEKIMDDEAEEMKTLKEELSKLKDELAKKEQDDSRNTGEFESVKAAIASLTVKLERSEDKTPQTKEVENRRGDSKMYLDGTTPGYQRSRYLISDWFHIVESKFTLIRAKKKIKYILY